MLRNLMFTFYFEKSSTYLGHPNSSYVECNLTVGQKNTHICIHKQAEAYKMEIKALLR